MYLTPLRLSKMFPNSSPKCHRCKTCIGSNMHIFWECKRLKHFWKAVHDLTVKVVETPLDSTPIRYLFGTELDKTLDSTNAKRISIISYIAKKCILLNWNQQGPPTFNLFKQILNDTLRLEQRTYTLKNKGDSFRRVWEPLMDLWHSLNTACSNSIYNRHLNCDHVWHFIFYFTYFYLFLFIYFIYLFFPFFFLCPIVDFIVCFYPAFVTPLLCSVYL